MVRIHYQRLRAPLAFVAFGSVALAHFGLALGTAESASLEATAAELAGVSLPLTVAWFAFSGTCMLATEEGGLSGVLASWSRIAGWAALILGVPVWAFWYLHLVFGVL